MGLVVKRSIFFYVVNRDRNLYVRLNSTIINKRPRVSHFVFRGACGNVVKWPILTNMIVGYRLYSIFFH